MRLYDFVRDPAGKLRRGVIADLVRKSGLSYPTVHGVANDRLRLRDYERARSLSIATGGVVSIAELCEAAKHATAAA